MYIQKTAHLLSRIKGYLANSAQREGLTLMLCLSYAYACVKHIWRKTHTAQHSIALIIVICCCLLVFTASCNLLLVACSHCALSSTAFLCYLLVFPAIYHGLLLICTWILLWKSKSRYRPGNLTKKRVQISQIICSKIRVLIEKAEYRS